MVEKKGKSIPMPSSAEVILQSEVINYFNYFW